ncbi:hypothetical protein [Amycolatopsis sp. NPDC098790]
MRSCSRLDATSSGAGGLLALIQVIIATMPLRTPNAVPEGSR